MGIRHQHYFVLRSVAPGRGRRLRFFFAAMVSLPNLPSLSQDFVLALPPFDRQQIRIRVGHTKVYPQAQAACGCDKDLICGVGK